MLNLTRRIVLLLAIALVAVGSMWAQSDRGTIAGVVTDQSGAVMAGVSVTATNTATGIFTSTKTQGGGSFTIPNLHIGPYQVVAEFHGFKKFIQSGITLEVGQTIAMDIQMQLGAVTETVQVTAQPLLEKDNTDRGSVVSARDVEELPIVSQSEQRNPGFYMSLVPGVNSRGTATPTASGSGRQLDTTVNGGTSGSTEFQLDGGTIPQSGGLSGDFRILVFPPEAVGEFKVMTLQAPAEYGASGLGITAFTLKSGSNTLHGSLFENIRNEDLDANSWAVNQGSPGCSAHPEYTKACRTLNKQNEFGATAGGPIVIPHLYNGRDKTFFFGWYHGYRLSQQGGSGTKDTLPTAAMKQGNESNVLGPSVGLDALGRPVYSDAIYNPTLRFVAPGAVDPVTGLTAATYDPAAAGPRVNPWPIRDAFGASAANGWLPSNIVPTGSMDPEAVKMFTYFADPPSCPSCNFGYQLNWIHPYPVQSTINDFGGKVDHNISNNHRIMGEYLWWHNYAPGGSKWPGAISEGGITYAQDDYARFADDYLFSPTLVNHFVAGFNRQRSDSYPTAGTGWPAKIGYNGVPQTGAGTTFPEMDIAGLGNTYSRGGQSYSANNDFTVDDNITWSKNRHTVKVGFSYIKMQGNGLSTSYQSSYLTFDSGTTGLPSYTSFAPQFDPKTGKPLPVPSSYNEGCSPGGTCSGTGISSFLLGQVDHGLAGITGAVTADRIGRYAGYIQDDIKWSPKLTINLGLRYDLMLPQVGAHNQVSWFDPNVVNPDIGIKGAMVFATPSRRAGATTFTHGVGPRVGLAYSLNNKTVVRAAYGIMYSAGGAERQGSYEAQGFSVTNAVNADSSTGFTGLTPAVIAGNSTYHMILQNGWPSNLLPTPPFISPSLLMGGGPPTNGAWTGDGHLPYMQDYTFDLQRELKGGILLDVAYVGTKGIHLPSRLMNSNVVPTYEVFKYKNQLFTSISDPTVQALPAVQNMPVSVSPGSTTPIHQPFATFSSLWGSNATLGQALRPFPQYTTDTVEGLSQMRDFGETVGVSGYNALQVQARKHFSQGLSFMLSYTYSKTLTNAESQYNEFSGFTQDFYNARGEKALSINDYPNNVVLSYEYQLPFGPGKKFANVHGAAGKIIGGWTIAGVQQYRSGAPSAINYGGGVAGYPYAGPNSFMGARANTVPGVPKKSAALRNGTWNPDGAGATGSIYNFNAWTAPPAWTFGTDPRTDGDARQFGYLNEDISLIKRTKINERVNVEFRGDFLNIFNRTVFGFDQGGDQYGQVIGGASLGNGIGGFGHVSSQSNFPREIQFGLKINY